MFSLTFLGHQGWLIATQSTTLLVDPLLTAGFGHGGLLGQVYPPRELDLAGFPAIDAVVLTHEHDDHFDLPSLARIDRAAPIYLSSRSSHAARGALAQLGFRVEALEPGATTSIGDLRWHGLVSDHHGGEQGDEWDVFPMWVEDAAGHGSVYSSIDVAAAAPARARPPGVWALAHNASAVGFQAREAPAVAASDDAGLVLAAALRRLAAAEASWSGLPAAALVCGQGWSFPGARAWINHEAFPVGPEQVAAALAAAAPRTLVRAPAPGFGVELHAGELVAVHERRPFLAALSRERWPDRSFRPGLGPRPDYSPASGRRSLAAGELDAILDELDELARYLYGGRVFRALASLPARVAAGVPAVGFSLRDGDGPDRTVLRYDPQGCRFVLDEGGQLLAGIELWASDLLGFLRGELSASALCYAGRLRSWSARIPGHPPLRLPADVLWSFAHPLRRPERAARLYARLLAELEHDAGAEPAARIRAR